MSPTKIIDGRPSPSLGDFAPFQRTGHDHTGEAFGAAVSLPLKTGLPFTRSVVPA
jgi:hypothetical protein